MIKRLENFWYHYKWTTIIIVFFLIVFFVFAVQAINRESYDVYMIYAGPVNIFSDEHNNIENAVKKFASSGENLKINIQNIIYVPEELAKEYSENDIYFNPAENQKAFNDFSKNAATGKNTILFLTPELYNFIKGRDALTPLSEIFENIPDSKYDEYGLKLSECNIYNEKGIDALPDDTIVCFRNSKSSASIMKSEKKSKSYEFQMNVFKKVFDN